MNYVINADLSKAAGHNVSINGQSIDDKVFDEEMVGYTYVDRVDLIEDIQRWLCEARHAGRTSDAVLMDQDIDYLKTLNDNYIFNSQSTNEYVAISDNPQRFYEICEEIIEADVELKQPLVDEAQKAFNAIIETGNVGIEIQLWPLAAYEYKLDTKKRIATIPSNPGCDLSELLMAIVDFCINQSSIYKKRDGIVYLAQETDVWFGTSDRNEIGIYTSEELAVLSAMKYTGEVLRAENGGYKSIREECDNGVYITQYGLDQEIES